MPHLTKQKQKIYIQEIACLPLVMWQGGCTSTVKFEVGVGGMRVRGFHVCVYTVCGN